MLQGSEDAMQRPGAAILTRDKLFGGEGRQQSHPVTRTHVATGTGTQRIPGDGEAQ